MSERSAVVTGAGQGIGRAVALSLGRAGFHVVASDVVQDGVDEVVGAIREAGGTATATTTDVTDEDGVEDLAATAGELATLGVWVNNAGISRPALLHKMETSDFDTVLRVHVNGTFFGMRAASRRMIEAAEGGVILNVTSSAGLQGTIGQINYAAAKGAITAMTKSGAKELARHDIRVNAVAPFAATPMTETLRGDDKLRTRYLEQVPMRRFAEPEEIADAFAFLASPAAAFVTGQVLCVDGGLYMAS